MKRVTLTFIALFALLSMSAQEILFQDDFESYDNFVISDIGDYTLVDVDALPTYGFNGISFDHSGDPFAYIVFNSMATDPPLEPSETSDWTAHSGNKAMGCFASVPDPDSGVIANNDWLITPAITLNEDGNNILTFWAKATDATYSQELFNVGVSTTDTDPDSFTFIAMDEVPLPPLEWQKFTYNLDDYAGQDVYIAINHVAADQFGFLVDDLSVSIGELSVKKQTFAGFTHYVAHNHLYVSANSPIQNVALYNMLGQRVDNQKIGDTSGEINLAGLSSGLYLVKAEINGQTNAFKIVKN